ncbi:MAG: L-2-amino-thiazoline-4-carboxylic acid hydrolase [Candidatus Thorarchaeota archaeon]|jgi:hypothetical protein
MSKRIVKRLVRRLAWRAKKKTLIQVLPSRCRQEGKPEFGRFTPVEIERMILRATANIKELMPFFIDYDSIGNYQNEYVGLLDLAIYRALVEENIASQYAMNLIGDLMWQAVVNSKGLIPIFDSLRKKFVKLKSKDSMVYLGKRLEGMMKYPYSEPGYKMEFYRDDDVYCMDIYSCPVFDFYKQFGEEEMTMFKKSWCTFDFTAGEHVVDGGRYEREHTLSHGDEVCDMRWSIAK